MKIQSLLLGALAIAAVATPTLADVSHHGVWALMITGFGAAGSAFRGRRDQPLYRLVETRPDGESAEELFPAPNDAAAIVRAQAVAAAPYELWRADGGMKLI